MIRVYEIESTVVTHWADVSAFSSVAGLVKICIVLQTGYEYFDTSGRITIELSFKCSFNVSNRSYRRCMNQTHLLSNILKWNCTQFHFAVQNEMQDGVRGVAIT